MRKFLFLGMCFTIDIFFLTIILNNLNAVKQKQPTATVNAQEEISLNNYFATQDTINNQGNVLGASKFNEIINATTSAVSTKSASILTSTKSASILPKKTETNADVVKTTINAPTALTVVFLGDSMIDTLGPDLPHLKNQLAYSLPNTKFTLINHGVGASNIESGIERLTNSYTYLNESRKSVLTENPDILVIESFAYNHWENNQSDINRHWMNMAKIVDIIKKQSPKTKIIFASSIAPYCPTYTDGSANLAPDQKYIQCQTVKVYLQNTVNFASSQKLPLADAYHASLNGQEGKPLYINQGDHIHPSDEGKALFAKKVSDAIVGLYN